ncbi:hypothetical protein XENOCAPTIV_011091 [Xenoophorus captivus]|uniref:Ig-like domain-containing protein n=1 Tax=Xenoophorus captivus TaxID=1517983 RepID=A0ABV0QHM4_9TELE
MYHQSDREFRTITQVKDILLTQQENSVVKKGLGPEPFNILIPESSPLLKQIDFISPIPSATPQEQASGAPPQVIRKIRGETFADGSGHLKLWCQFFNVLSDSSIRWYKNEQEICQVKKRSAVPCSTGFFSGLLAICYSLAWKHKCNYFCGLLGLRSLKVMDSLSTPTKPKGSKSPLLQRKKAVGSSSPQTSRKAAVSPRMPRKAEHEGNKTPSKQEDSDAHNVQT